MAHCVLLQKRRVDMQSQNTQILTYMEEVGAISPITALNEFGCFRLASRIHDLRSIGYEIVTERVRVGEKTYATYKMGDSQGENCRPNRGKEKAR